MRMVESVEDAEPYPENLIDSSGGLGKKLLWAPAHAEKLRLKGHTLTAAREAWDVWVLRPGEMDIWDPPFTHVSFLDSDQLFAKRSGLSYTYSSFIPRIKLSHWMSPREIEKQRTRSPSPASSNEMQEIEDGVRKVALSNVVTLSGRQDTKTRLDREDDSEDDTDLAEDDADPFSDNEIVHSRRARYSEAHWNRLDDKRRDDVIRWDAKDVSNKVYRRYLPFSDHIRYPHEEAEDVVDPLSELVPVGEPEELMPTRHVTGGHGLYHTEEKPAFQRTYADVADVPLPVTSDGIPSVQLPRGSSSSGALPEILPLSKGGPAAPAWRNEEGPPKGKASRTGVCSYRGYVYPPANPGPRFLQGCASSFA